MLSLTRYLLLLLLPIPVCAATDDLLFGLGLRQGGGTAAVAYTANAVDFGGAGSDDSMRVTTTPTGLTDGKAFTISFWHRLDGSDGSIQRYTTFASSSSNRLNVSKTTGNALNLTGQNSAGTSILSATGTTTLVAGSAWRHIICSIDLANTANRACYIDDSAESVTWTTYTDDTLDMDIATTPRYTIMGSNGATPANLVDGCIAEFWFDDVFIDLSVEATRRKFRSAAGKPVNLGADGSVPTGSQPVLYFKTASPNFETNSGSGGNFTENGAIDACSNSPSS